MRFRSRQEDEKEIVSLADWERLGKPASRDHWREGRSAYELAADWIERDAVERVTGLLSLRPELAGLELIEGIAEQQTRFDEIPHGPRNHDLLVRASTSAGVLVVGVEGKADEPFDHPLWRWRQRALSRTESSRSPARLDHLTMLFFGTTIDKDDAYPSLGCLGYQLLAALAGTLAEAKKHSAARAVLLVHEFVTDETDDEKHRRNASGLEDFLGRLSSSWGDRAGSTGQWITAPTTVRGDGDRMPESLPVSVAKLVTNRRTT